MTPTEEARNFLVGLKLDIVESENEQIDIDPADIEQIDNLLQLLEGKPVTKERLVEIQKEWMKDSIKDGLLDQSLVEVHAGWQDPGYHEDCAQYVWERL